MVVIKDVIIKEAQQSDIRKGWIRINKKLRGPELVNEKVYKVSVPGKGSTYRMVLGNDELPPIKDGVFMDFGTRNELKVLPNEKVNIEFNEINWWESWFGYNWKHPDFAYRSAYRVGMVLGIGGIIITLILSILGIVLTISK